MQWCYIWIWRKEVTYVVYHPSNFYCKLHPWAASFIPRKSFQVTFSSVQQLWTGYCEVANCFGHGMQELLRELRLVVRSQHANWLGCLFLVVSEYTKQWISSTDQLIMKIMLRYFDWHPEAVNLEHIKIKWKLLQLVCDCVIFSFSVFKCHILHIFLHV